MTVKEIEAKKASFEAIIANAPAIIPTLVPLSPEFDAFCTAYSEARGALTGPKALDWDKLLSDALAEDNKDAIAVAGTAISEAIQSALDGLEVEKLMGKPITNLNWLRPTEKVTEKDAQGAEVVVTKLGKGVVRFNPVTNVRASGPRADKPADGAEKKGHTMITGPDGAIYSLTKFVVTHATEAEKASAPYKYPHTRVDSKPKFEKFCTEHNLSGFTYGA